jgi:hypothetical protein
MAGPSGDSRQSTDARSSRRGHLACLASMFGRLRVKVPWLFRSRRWLLACPDRREELLADHLHVRAWHVELFPQLGAARLAASRGVSLTT